MAPQDADQIAANQSFRDANDGTGAGRPSERGSHAAPAAAFPAVTAVTAVTGAGSCSEAYTGPSSGSSTLARAKACTAAPSDLTAKRMSNEMHGRPIKKGLAGCRRRGLMSGELPQVPSGSS